jgi:hypothetical protein
MDRWIKFIRWVEYDNELTQWLVGLKIKTIENGRYIWRIWWIFIVRDHLLKP